ncbi:MAG: TIGR03032 family protein [Planctomycetales bacterium]|nr:TIGR03032 family protein [Planctomycetales bacterium]
MSDTPVPDNGHDGAAETADGQPDGPPPLRSVHTSNFSAILQHFGCSLLVTTYQAGKLVVVRSDADNPNLINTHFRTFNKPMGLALGNQRLGLGTAQEIIQFRNVPAAAARLEPKGKHDACFLPRSLHVTGDVQIHEMFYIGDELWFVNTAFSCLCTYDEDHSFVPRWRPWFVSALTPEDRCHLNGVCVVDGRPKWATALGETDTQGGWRENKKDGGILIDIENERIISRGLSMPHSPRWYADRLWLLESGTGSFGHVDPITGEYTALVKLGGFTRGIDFAGNLAFIGLSQVRETATFSGIPITENLEEKERICGVWVVDIRNGDVVAFVRFEDAVQEIFAVVVLPGTQFPDIVNDDPKITGSSYVLPDEALRDVPDALRSAGASTQAADESAPRD